jgi:hypothetical protein
MNKKRDMHFHWTKIPPTFDEGGGGHINTIKDKGKVPV